MSNKFDKWHKSEAKESIAMDLIKYIDDDKYNGGNIYE